MVKRDNLFFIFAFLVVLIDQITKFFIRTNNIDIKIAKFLSIQYTTNSGIAFGLLQGYNMILVFFYLIVLGIILYNYEKVKRFFVPGFLVLGGLVGNLIDRITLGYVVDFISIGLWPSFNIADACIFIGIILLVIKILKSR